MPRSGKTKWAGIAVTSLTFRTRLVAVLSQSDGTFPAFPARYPYLKAQAADPPLGGTFPIGETVVRWPTSRAEKNGEKCSTTRWIDTFPRRKLRQVRRWAAKPDHVGFLGCYLSRMPRSNRDAYAVLNAKLLVDRTEEALEVAR